MHLRGRTYDLSPGDCFVIRMNEPCVGTHDPRHPLTVHWAFVEYPLEWPVGDEHLPRVHRRVRDLTFMTTLFERALTAQQDGVDERAKEWLLAVIRALYEDDSRDMLPPESTAGRQFRQIQAISSRIRENPGTTFKIPELAAECHCTPGHFTRRFEKYMGTSPRDFIVNVRIEAAKSQLRMSDHTISSIADSLGYGDVFHFSKQFKERTGIPPSKFRGHP